MIAPPPTPNDPLSLEALGVADMSCMELADLSEKLARVSVWVAEYRFLRLEHEHEVLARMAHCPTIGYYLQLRTKRPA